MDSLRLWRSDVEIGPLSPTYRIAAPARALPKARSETVKYMLLIWSNPENWDAVPDADYASTPRWTGRSSSPVS